MNDSLALAARLIVAADYELQDDDSSCRDHDKREGTEYVKTHVRWLAQALKGTGVCIKVNSALRMRGYELIDKLREDGFKVFADLKLYDTPETLKKDAKLLAEFEPDMVTMSCFAGREAMRRVKDHLPDTKVLGVTVLSSMDDHDISCITNFGDVFEGVRRLSLEAVAAEIDGIVCAPAEIQLVRSVVGDSMLIVSAGIRPAWGEVRGDDQNLNRVMTPAQAIAASGDCIVVGRPITKSNDPHEAVMRTLDEIASALA